MKKNLFEIFLTSPFIKSKEWLNLIFKVSRINGIFKSWNLWIYIENNYIRYFIETKRMFPSIIGELGEFLLKKSDIELKEKSKIGVPYLLTKNHKTLLDIYDRNEARKARKLKKIKITIYPYQYDNYFAKTFFYFKSSDGKMI